MADTVRITCTHDCPDACSALITVENGRAVGIRADDRHPVTGRHLCSKVDRYLERVYAPDRLTTPLRRTGSKGSGSFEPMSWPDALDEIADRWKQIIAESGGEAILPFSYLGNMGALSAFGPTFALFNHLGASQLFRGICGGQALAINRAMGAVQADPELIVDSELIVCWGIDIVFSSIHTWDLVRKARANGARLVVIDPYRSATAKRADEHLAIRPGTDGALALGLAHAIIAADLVDDDYVADHTRGFDDFAALVAEWTPERTAAETGLSVEQVVELAKAYATAEPATIRFGVGMQRADGAGMAVRAIQCLPALAGHWRHRGGGIVNARTMTMLGFERMHGPNPGTRTFNMIRIGRALTDPDLDPPVRSLFVWNSNPAVITGDQNRVLEGLARDDLFTVVHDLFLTDTARYADIVLPAPSMLEHEDLVGSWGFNYIAINRAAIDPIGESRANSWVARELAGRMELEAPIFSMTDDELMRHCLDGGAAEAAGAGYERLDGEGFVRVEHPGGEVPYAEGGFPGADDGRFEFASPRFDQAFGLGPLPHYIAPGESPESAPELAERYPLRLLTLKRPHSINSSYGDLPVLRGAEPDLVIEINPADADARDIDDRSPVAAHNDRGRVVGLAAVTDRVRPGVVAVPFGRWLDGGQGANALTDDRIGDLGGGPTFCDVLVEVSPGVTEPTNVAVVLLDSLNRHMLGCYGSDEFETPNLDRFAATHATRFTNHVTGSLPCMPARHDILCGALDFLWKPWGSIELWEAPITRVLHGSGVTSHLATDHPHLFETGGENYHTDFDGWEYVRGHEGDLWRTHPDPTWAGTPALPARRGGWFYEKQFGIDRLERGYDKSRTFFRAEVDWPGPRTMLDAERFLTEAAPHHDRWFLFVDEFDPHEPFDTPAPWAGRYFDEPWDDEWIIWPPYIVGGLESGALDEREARHVRANYGAKLSMIDHWFGRILDAFDRDDLWADTALIVCTDHGHYLGDVREGKDIWGKPGVPQFEPLGHTPLLIHWPGASVEPGGTCDALTTNVDLFATIADAFDAEVAHPTHGRSLAPLLRGEAASVRDWAIGGVWGNWVQVTDGRHKYARAPEGENRPLSMWSNRWSTMPLHMSGVPPMPLPDDRAVLDTMPGVDVPVIRQRWGSDDRVPFWAAGKRVVGRHHLYDLDIDPDEGENRHGESIEAELVDLLRTALVELEAPPEQFERLGLG